MAQRNILLVWTVLGGGLAVGGCQPASGDDGGDPGPPGDAAGGDTAPAGDSAAAGDSDWGGDLVSGEFTLRVPGSRPIECDDPISGGTTTVSFWDVDHVCTIDNGALQAELYVQASAVGCFSGMSYTPLFEIVGAWVKIGGELHPVEGAYDWGGNHHNDLLHFAYDGQLYAIWHSSIGVGWRRCAPVDCLLVCEASATPASCDPYGGFTTDGCERAAGSGPPPLPVICVTVNADGSVPDRLDPWTAQVSDPDYPLLPCSGEQ